MEANTMQTTAHATMHTKESLRKKFGLYLWLAKINLFISSFTFGGGYVVVPMVRKYFTEKKDLFTEEELMEMAAIAQSSPGAIAINLVALAGYRAGGTAGLFISCICAVIPPILILAVISLCYSAFIANTLVAAVLKGMQAGVAALIVDFIADMTGVIAKERSWVLNLLVLLSFCISFFTNINVMLVLLCSCLICIIRACINQKKQTLADRKFQACPGEEN